MTDREGRRNEDGTTAQMDSHELAMLLADADALAKRRRRLSGLSWFMAALCEPVICIDLNLIRGAGRYTRSL